MVSVTFYIVSLFLQVRDFFLTMDPAYLNLVKIFAGCFGWIGGLFLFIWTREKRKIHQLALLNNQREA